MCTCTCSAAAVWDACCIPHKGTSKNLPPLFSDLLHVHAARRFCTLRLECGRSLRFRC
ncbi:MAG: hypothetical protein FD149_754 [Rhodospirillaceae bacterium]|nr:MAG: hypothetical protein FD149_754 [Rhodospirillaceae bacterium]